MKKIVIALLMSLSFYAFSMKVTAPEAIQTQLAELEVRLVEARKDGNDRLTSRLLLRMGQLNYNLQNYAKATSYVDELLALSNPNLRDRVSAARLQQLIANK